MKTAIIIIAVCEVIRTIQITLDIIFGIQARKQTLASINKVGDSVADDFTADKLARAIVREAKAERMSKCDYCQHVEMCGWRESLEERGCDFFDDGNKWIPVSERLPEYDFGCLVTVEEDDIYGEPQSVIFPEFVGYDGETWNNADGEPIPFEVITWMPLPKPYKVESEE